MLVYRSCTPTGPPLTLAYQITAQTKSRGLGTHSTISLKVGPITYFQRIYGLKRSNVQFTTKNGRKYIDDVTCKPPIQPHEISWHTLQKVLLLLLKSSDKFPLKSLNFQISPPPSLPSPPPPPPSKKRRNCGPHLSHFTQTWILLSVRSFRVDIVFDMSLILFMWVILFIHQSDEHVFNRHSEDHAMMGTEMWGEESRGKQKACPSTKFFDAVEHLARQQCIF